MIRWEYMSAYRQTIGDEAGIPDAVGAVPPDEWVVTYRINGPAGTPRVVSTTYPEKPDPFQEHARFLNEVGAEGWEYVEQLHTQKVSNYSTTHHRRSDTESSYIFKRKASD